MTKQDASDLFDAIVDEWFPEAPTPLKEFEFVSFRKWRFDRAWPSVKLAVEIHGATWRGGRHTSGKGFANDREKINEAIEQGWVVLEYTTDSLKQRPEDVAGQFGTVYGMRMGATNA